MRQFVYRLLREGTGDDYIGPASQIARHIFERLTVANQAHLRHNIAAQLLHGEFERHARAERRLFEKERGVLALQRGRKTRARLLDLFREVENGVQLFDR